MSEKFSPALRLADLNDFIAPSQDCIVSLKAIKSKHDKAENQEKVRSTSQPSQTEAVKISLKDCLACSGCVTSAETVCLRSKVWMSFWLMSILGIVLLFPSPPNQEHH